MKNLFNRKSFIKLITLSISILTLITMSFTGSLTPNQSNAQSTNSQPSQIQAEDGSTVSASFYQSSVTYTITSTQNNEYHAQSTTDNTGLFFTQSDLINVNQSSLQLSEGDTILVSFDDYETITSIKLIKGESK